MNGLIKQILMKLAFEQVIGLNFWRQRFPCWFRTSKKGVKKESRFGCVCFCFFCTPKEKLENYNLKEWLLTIKFNQWTSTQIHQKITHYLIVDPRVIEQRSSLWRWLKTCIMVNCVVMKHSHTSHIAWRRLQVHEQQSERQRKNPFQKANIFHQRAHSKITEDPCATISFMESTVFRLSNMNIWAVPPLLAGDGWPWCFGFSENQLNVGDPFLPPVVMKQTAGSWKIQRSSWLQGSVFGGCHGVQRLWVCKDEFQVSGGGERSSWTLWIQGFLPLNQWLFFISQDLNWQRIMWFKWLPIDLAKFPFGMAGGAGSACKKPHSLPRLPPQNCNHKVVSHRS